MSKRFRVVVQPEAQAAFETAYQRMEEHSSERAKTWANGFVQAIESLAISLARCPVAPESQFFSQTIRQRLYGKRGQQYRILFTIEKQTVSVLFIRHAAQDWLRPQEAEG